MCMCMYSMNAIEAQCWMPLHPPPGSCTNPKTSHQMVTPRIQLLRGCTLGKAANIRHIRAFLKVLPLTDGMRASLTHSTMWVKSNQAQHYKNSSTLYLRLNIVRALWKHSRPKINFSFKSDILTVGPADSRLCWLLPKSKYEVGDNAFSSQGDT